jgi:large subunit ribosomal protein L22
MEKKIYKSQFKNVAQSAQKLRLVADVVRGKRVDIAVSLLTFLNKKGSKTVLKTLNSAAANAKSLDGITPEKLYITKISVDEATTLKRVIFESRANVSTLNKRRSHLNIELSIK